MESRLKCYRGTASQQQWQGNRTELLCLVRRAQPTSISDLRLFLQSASGLLSWAEAHYIPGTITDLLGDGPITRYLRQPFAENTRKFYRARLNRLMAAAYGLPRHRRQASGRASLPAHLAGLRAWMEAPVPLLANPAKPISTHEFTTIIATLPAGDLPTYEQVLRG